MRGLSCGGTNETVAQSQAWRATVSIMSEYDRQESETAAVDSPCCLFVPSEVHRSAGEDEKLYIGASGMLSTNGFRATSSPYILNNRSAL